MRRYMQPIPVALGEPISVEAPIKKAIFRVSAQGGAGRTGIEHDTLSGTD
jgi:hypothetical protein